MRAAGGSHSRGALKGLRGFEKGKSVPSGRPALPLFNPIALYRRPRPASYGGSPVAGREANADMNFLRMGGCRPAASCACALHVCHGGLRETQDVSCFFLK